MKSISDAFDTVTAVFLDKQVKPNKSNIARAQIQFYVVISDLPWQKEVMTIFVILNYGPKTKFYLKYLIFNRMFYIVIDVQICCLKVFNISTASNQLNWANYLVIASFWHGIFEVGLCLQIARKQLCLNNFFLPSDSFMV